VCAAMASCGNARSCAPNCGSPATVTETAARLLNDLPIADIGIEEVPIEEIIGQVFRGRQACATAAK